jgi:hypothetical protein
MFPVRLPDIHVRRFEFTGVKLRRPHRLFAAANPSRGGQVCVPLLRCAKFL